MDTLARPWHTIAAEEHARELAELRARLASAEQETKAAKGQLHDVLVEYVVEPATGVVRGISDGVDDNGVPEDVVESTTETLEQNLNAGLAVAELAELARGLLTDWAEERR